MAFRASNLGCAFWLNGEPPALSITGNCDECTYSRDSVTGNLHEICLPQRVIASIVNGTFDGMPSMMKLRLGWNEITEFYSGTFSHNLSLLDLDQRDTQIAELHPDTLHTTTQRWGKFDSLSTLSRNYARIFSNIRMKSEDFVQGIELQIPQQQPLVVIPLRHGRMHQELMHETVMELYDYKRMLRNPGFDSRD